MRVLMSSRATFVVLAALACGHGSGNADGVPGATRSLLLDPSHEEWRAPAPAVSHLRVETTKGVFVLELHRDWGPIGADRVYNLARLGYYDGTRDYR